MDRPAHPPSPDASVTTAWRAHRRRLLDIGYRMLGSVADAEDATQEAYARLARADAAAIDDVEGWLVTVTSRICIDHLRARRSRRAAYPGPWLPEPLVELPDGAPGPDEVVTVDESVRMALLVVLERLTPAERTAFILHDVFQLPFDTVAPIVGRSPAACRQLASRARRRIAAGDLPEPSAPGADHDPVTRAFATACATGSVDELVAVLDPDVVGELDSGGHLPGAPAGPVVGATRVARLLVRSFAGSGAAFAPAVVNGEPGVVVRVGDQVVVVIALAVRDGRIHHLHAVGNPAKLAGVQPR